MDWQYLPQSSPVRLPPSLEATSGPAIATKMQCLRSLETRSASSVSGIATTSPESLDGWSDTV
jgi:hypothetical protein